MTSLKTLNSLFLLIFLAACGGITGNVVDDFQVAVVVQASEMREAEFLQNITPATFSDAVGITIPIRYFGSGEEILNVSIPANFTNGYSWYVREANDTKNATQNGQYITWLANKSVENATLHFTVPAPTLSTVSIERSNTRYEKTVIVSAPNSFKGVYASTTVDENYDEYALFEGSSDVSTTYGFVVEEGIASWYGFHLSNRTFLLRAQNNAVDSSSGGRNVCIDCEVLCFDGSYEAREEYCPEPEEKEELVTSKPVQLSHKELSFSLKDEDYEFSIEIINGYDMDRNYTVESSVVLPQMQTLSLGRGERTTLTFIVPKIMGEWEDSIHVRSNDVDEIIEVRVLREERPEPIEAVQESPAQTTSWPWISILLVLALLGFFVFRETRK